MNTSADGQVSIIAEVSEYLLRTVVYTPVFFVGTALINFMWTFVALRNPSLEISAYIIYALASWALLMGQYEATGRLDDSGEEELESGITVAMMRVGTVIYYNLMMLLTVFVALVVEIAIGPVAAVAIAFSAPALDIIGTDQYEVGVAVVVLFAFLWLGEKITAAYERIPARDLIEGVARIGSSLGDAVPPAIEELSLGSITRRRRAR